MSRKSKYFAEVERLLKVGYEPKDIFKISGIPKATVYRIVNKLQVEARYDFKRTMSHDFLWKYQMNMENLSTTIQQLNEEMEVVKSKYATIESDIRQAIELLSLPKQASAQANFLMALISCQSSRTNELIKLASQRDKATEAKAKLFNQGPVVHSVHEWVNNNPPMGELPSIPELDEFVNKRQEFQLSKPEELNTAELTPEEEEELRIQKEMEEDEG